MVLTEVFFTEMVAPGNGEFVLSSLTLPLIFVCAKAAPENIKKIRKNKRQHLQEGDGFIGYFFL